MKNYKGKLFFMIAGALTGTLLFGTSIQADTGTESSVIPEGVELNYHEMEAWDTSFSDEELAGIPRVYGVLPQSYSSSSKIDGIAVEEKADYVTEVKSQAGGSCWAHAATSIAETSYIKNEGITDTICSDLIDFSEYHLVYYGFHSPVDSLNLFGGDKSENTSGLDDLEIGGNVELALCDYANWIGVSDSTEITSANVKESHSDELAFEDVAHLENGYILSMPRAASATYQNDMNIVKQMIMDYGSVSVSYYAGNSSYYANGYQYCDTDITTNHAVTIVGWDDSIPATSFLEGMQPEGNGAWLVKNSWGTGWGLNGYFWLSYYDASIGENAVALDFTTSDNYDKNYQYDGSGNIWTKIGYGKEQVAAANAFVAQSAESLEAVGFYTDVNNMDYEIRIYRNLEAGALPQTGELVLTQEGNELYAGFHTVELTKSISLKANERYAIVITWKKEGTEVFTCVDKSYSYDWITFTSYAKAGESYSGYTVDRLSDLNPSNTDYAEGRNVRIKAFTNEMKTVSTTGVSLNKTTATLSSGETLQLSAAILPANATYQGVTFTSADTSLATVDKNGLVKANVTGKSGTTTITARSEEGNKTAVCKVNVKPVLVTGISLNKSSVSLKPGNSATISAVISPNIATNKGVTWSSSNTKVATIDQNGKVTAVSEGSATITATAKDGSGVKRTCAVSVVHDWNSSYTIDKAATYTETGSKSIHCKVCNAKKDSQTIPVLNGLAPAKNGVRYYYENGKVKTSLTTLIKNNGTWYYVQKGVVSGKYTGLVKYNGSWYYVKNSKIDFSYTGLCKYGSTWYYIEKGVLNWNYTGLCKYGSTWYYVQRGVLNWNYTGLCKYGSTWYYVQKGVLNWNYTGLCKYGSTWYYVQRGVLNWNYTGYTYYGGSRWYVKNGIMVRRA